MKYDRHTDPEGKLPNCTLGLRIRGVPSVNAASHARDTKSEPLTPSPSPRPQLFVQDEPPAGGAEVETLSRLRLQGVGFWIQGRGLRVWELD